MADTKTSDENPASTLTGAELVRIVQDGADARTTTGDIAALSSSGSDLGWVVVEGFTDAEMDAAVAAINASSTGGTVFLPMGTYTWTTSKVFTKPVVIRGCGCGDDNMANALTTVNFTSATADAITFNVDPAHVFDLQLNNTASTTPTAGAGLHWLGGNGLRMGNVNVNGFWDDYQVDAGAEWFTSNVVAFGPVNYGAYVRNTALPDGGDQSFVGWQFIAHTNNAVAGLRYESGGGFKGVNIKVNQRGSAKFATGLDIEIAASAATSDFLLMNSSIENVSGSAIKVRNASGGTLENIIINGVQFSNYGSTVSAIDIAATADGVFDVLTIDACDFNIESSTANCISITNVDKVAIGLCRQTGHPNLVTLSGVTHFANANAAFHTEDLTDGATIALDLTNSEGFRLTLAGNHTLANPTNICDGQTGQIRVTQGSGGSHTLTLGSKYKVPGGTLTLSSAAGALDVLSFQYDATQDTVVLVPALAFA